MKNINKYAVSLFVIVAVLLGAILLSPSDLNKQKNTSANTTPIVSQALANEGLFTYTGKNGIDALTLLKEKTEVIQDDSGLVTSINSRAADPKKKEFWSFYVNGEMATVGPADFMTKDEDSIEWKIEAY